jgi:hypothetical protein
LHVSEYTNFGGAIGRVLRVHRVPAGAAPWAIRKPDGRQGTPDGRPFLRPYTDRSAGHTQNVVTSLFDWPTIGRHEPKMQPRFLSPDDTALLREAMAARPGAVSDREARLANARELLAADLFEQTGLRGTAMGHAH